MKLEITNIEDARELLELCGYPVYPAKWVTYGGGSAHDFDTDEEVIEFAEDMRKRVDDQVLELLKDKPAFEKVMKDIGFEVDTYDEEGNQD